jgi:hypothetical protein
MPPVSQRQRAAMHAAAAGKSTLGISKKVGTEFVASDPGGKLPEHKKPAAKKPFGSFGKFSFGSRKKTGRLRIGNKSYG